MSRVFFILQTEIFTQHSDILIGVKRAAYDTTEHVKLGCVLRCVQLCRVHHKWTLQERNGIKEYSASSNDVFTLSGTETGTATRTIGNNRSLPCPGSGVNVKVSTVSYNPFVPEPVPILAGVNTPLDGLYLPYFIL